MCCWLYGQQQPHCHVFLIKSKLNGEIPKVKNQLEKFDSVVTPDVLLPVLTPLQLVLHTIHAYPRRHSRGISDIPPGSPCFTKMEWINAMRNTEDVIGGKPCTVWSQSMSGVSAVNNLLLAFYCIHRRKGEELFFCSVSNTTQDYHLTSELYNANRYLAFSKYPLI
jgi:hypothetical protein